MELREWICNSYTDITRVYDINTIRLSEIIFCTDRYTRYTRCRCRIPETSHVAAISSGRVEEHTSLLVRTRTFKSEHVEICHSRVIHMYVRTHSSSTNT